MTELLVVLAIVGLLATMAVPTYLTQVERSRVVTAREEARVLAEAEDRCAMVHGFYVPLQVLNDTATPPERFGDEPYDDLLNTRRFLDPCYLIDASASFATLQNQARTPGTFPQPKLQWSEEGDADHNQRVVGLYEYWAGPFANFRRAWTGKDFKPNVPQALDDYERARGYPLDPWGRPYRLYSPLGVVGGHSSSASETEPASPDDLDQETFSNGELTEAGGYEFDRFAIVSYGPNGAESDADLTDPIDFDDDDNDDIIYLFGRLPNESAFRAF